MGKFLIRQVATGYKFDLKAQNGETIATSEVYRTEAACRKGILSVCRSVPVAGVEDGTERESAHCPNPKFQVFRDRAGAYRFRLCARNGKIVAVSEAYSSKNGCLDGVESVINNIKSLENPEIFGF